MPIRPRYDGWQVDVYARGRRVRVQLDGSKPEAQALEAQIKADLLAGREPALPQASGRPAALAPAQAGPGLTLEQLRDACMKLRPQWAQGRNLDMLRVNTNDVIRILGANRPVAEIGMADVDKLTADFNARGLAPVTRNNKYSVLSTMMRFAEARGWGRRVPVPIVKPGAGRTRVVTEAEEAAVIAWLTTNGRPDEADYVAVAIDLGTRNSELHRLEARDWDGTFVKLWVTKTGRARGVPATPRVKAILSRRIATLSRGDPTGDTGEIKVFGNVTKHTLRRAWNLARDALKLGKDTTPYALRHTFCTRLIELNVNPLLVRDLAGHADLSTTNRYVHPNDQMRLAAIQALAGRPVPLSPVTKQVTISPAAASGAGADPRSRAVSTC